MTIRNLFYPYGEDAGEPEQSPLDDPFDVHARQIALAVGMTEGISIDDAELLKQWLTNFIQDNINNEEIQL